MALTSAELDALLREVAAVHEAAAVLVAGTTHPALGERRVRELQRLGYLSDPLPPPLVRDGYQLGRLEQIARADIAGAEPAALLARARALPLSDADRRALDYVERRAGQFIVALAGGASSRIVGRGTTAQAQSNLRRFVEGALRPQLATGILERQSRRAIASDLAEAAGDWTRDWMRVAHTEVHFAHQHGSAVALMDSAQRAGAPDPQVEVLVRADSCPECHVLYELHGEPVVFSLAALLAEGTNVGVPRRAWRPVVPPAHPNCTCRIRPRAPA